jgi:hypothetical protein
MTGFFILENKELVDFNFFDNFFYYFFTFTSASFKAST